MKTKTIILMLFFQNILFSQNPFLEINFGVSDIQYFEKTGETPGFHNGSLFQVNLGNEFDLKKKKLYLKSSIFYRVSKNSLNVDWVTYIPYNKKNDFEFNTELIGLRTELKKKIPFNIKNKISIAPKLGLNFGYFTKQNFVNPIYYDEGFTLYYGDNRLNKFKNEVKFFDDFYLSNNIGIELDLNIKNFNVYINPDIEFQINHVFRKEQFDESYINYNLGIGIKYDF